MDGHQNERRTMRRLPADTISPIQIQAETAQAEAAQEPLTVNVADISLQGLGIVAPDACLPGTVLAIQPAGEHRRVPKLTATVCHATARQDGRWVLGCALSRYLTVDDMMALAG